MSRMMYARTLIGGVVVAAAFSGVLGAQQIRTARRHLPRGYSRDLPRLTNHASAGYPRVYDIALEAIAHGDGVVRPGRRSQGHARTERSS